MYNVREGRERRNKKEGERERGGERKERVVIIWIGFRKDGHHNFTFELCRKAIYLLYHDTRKEHGRVRIWGDV